ncbi:hypothetical protein N431DRAFT_557673 [Stipitochalara longipes BDJ]|nr:hypothetical protein N431DRAFT_557673 [Stipitochalara longipes BDJ]
MAGFSGHFHESDSEDESEHRPAARNLRKYKDPLKGSVKSLNLEVKKYCKKWQPRHAFREFYQNWEDAIRKTNNLGRKNFAKEPHHDTSMLCFKAIHLDTGAERGYIRLLKERGVLELTNYDAWLPGNSLNIGSTSKSGNDDMAGSHGEGYKLAALILKDQGFDVNIKASECDWEFFVPAEGDKHEGVLCIDIKKRASTRLQTAKNTYARKIDRNGPMTLRQNVWQDVTTQIGKQFKRSVTEEEFLQWIKCALDLDPPRRAVETPFGSIILDPKLSNKVFLKGIFLEDSTTTTGSMTLKFGYNLPQGEVDGERRRLEVAQQQAYQLSQIWGAAIKFDRALLIEYISMLQSEIPPEDVRSATSYMSGATARLVWQYLVEENSEKKKFYYNIENATEVEVIVNCLKKEPAPLKSELWKTLRCSGILQTPQERREQVLCNSPVSLREESAYSRGMKRTLMRVSALDSKTRHLEITFKSGADADLDLLIHDSSLLINDKWLDFKSSHECRDCDLSLEASTHKVDIDTFDCGHIITELYGALVADLARNQQGKYKLSSEDSASLLRRAGEKIRQIPSRVSIAQGANAGEIVVYWTDSESDRIFKNHGIIRQGRITLHRESTCSILKAEILSSGNEVGSTGSTTIAACGCPQQIILLKDSSVRFTGLSSGEEYFPMISGIAPQSFFGFPPTPMRPSTSREDSQVLANVNEPTFSPGSTNEEDDDSASSSEGGGTGVVQSSTSSQNSATSTANNGSREGGPSSTNSQGPQRSLTNIKLRRAEREIRRLEGELETAQANLVPLRAEVSRLIAEQESIHDELTSMTESYNEKNQQLQEAKTENQAQRQQLAEKDEALENLRLNIQEKQQEQTRIKASLEDAQARLNSLQTEVEPLRRNEEKARAEIESLNIDVQQLRTQNDNLSEDLGGAERDIRHAYQQLQGRKRTREAEQEQEATAKRTKI